MKSISKLTILALCATVSLPTWAAEAKSSTNCTVSSTTGGVTGSNCADTLKGTAQADHIYGKRGNDTIQAGKGNDKVRGGRGDDTITGNRGNDTLRGRRGDDTVTGSRGNDVIYGGHGEDTEAGGRGNDKIHAVLGTDTVKAGSGNDTVYAGKGDTVDTGQGNDKVVTRMTNGNDMTVDGRNIARDADGNVTVNGKTRELNDNGVLKLKNGTRVKFKEPHARAGKKAAR